MKRDEVKIGGVYTAKVTDNRGKDARFKKVDRGRFTVNR
jgi:hypothetical protein